MSQTENTEKTLYKYEQKKHNLRIAIKAMTSCGKQTTFLILWWGKNFKKIAIFSEA